MLKVEYQKVKHMGIMQWVGRLKTEDDLIRWYYFSPLLTDCVEKTYEYMVKNAGRLEDFG